MCWLLWLGVLRKFQLYDLLQPRPVRNLHVVALPLVGEVNVNLLQLFHERDPDLYLLAFCRPEKYFLLDVSLGPHLRLFLFVLHFFLASQYTIHTPLLYALLGIQMSSMRG